MFTRETRGENDVTTANIESIRILFVRAQLPPEVLAFAYNILIGLKCQSTLREPCSLAPSDILIVSVLSLAIAYLLDHQPASAFWSRDICDCRWTAQQIDEVRLKILGAGCTLRWVEDGQLIHSTLHRPTS